MALQTMQEAGVIFREESTYGVPQAPQNNANANIDIVRCTGTDESNIIDDPTRYSKYASRFYAVEGHSQGSFSLTFLWPIAKASNIVADTGASGFMALLMGKAKKAASSTNKLPAYAAGDAFADIDEHQADIFEMGEAKDFKSFTLWNRTGPSPILHECYTGCVAQRVELVGGIDEFLMFNVSGPCKRVSKLANAVVSSFNATAKTVVFKEGSMIGVGNYISFDAGSNQQLVTAYDPKTRTATLDVAPTGISNNETAVDGLPGAVRTNREIASIFGDGFQVSIDSGETVQNLLTSITVGFDTGLQLFNQDGTSLTPTQFYKDPERVQVDFTGTFDPNKPTLLAEAYNNRGIRSGTDKELHILFGGTDGDDGGRCLVRIPRYKFERRLPETPETGPATYSLPIHALANLTNANPGVYTPPMIVYVF